MITITIKQSGKTDKPIKKNVVTQRTPTTIVQETKDRYDPTVEKKVQFIEEFAVIDAMETESWEITILQQQILDDTTFNLAKVIAAVNGL